MKPTRPDDAPTNTPGSGHKAACKGCEGVDSKRLAPCSSCGRHVFADSARCPFCGIDPALASVPGRPSTWAPRVAAIVAMTALASCDRPASPASDQPSSGAAAQSERARAGSDAGQREPTPEPTPMTAVPPYGVAPPPPQPPVDAGPDAVDAPVRTSLPGEEAP